MLVIFSPLLFSFPNPPAEISLTNQPFWFFCFLENFWKLYFEQTSNKRKYALIDFVFAHL